MLSVRLSHTHTRWQAIKMAVTSHTHDSFPGGTKKCLLTLFFFFFLREYLEKKKSIVFLIICFTKLLLLMRNAALQHWGGGGGVVKGATSVRRIQHSAADLGVRMRLGGRCRITSP